MKIRWPWRKRCIYVVIANDEERVQECIVLTNSGEANKVYKKLRRIWGGANVAMCSRAVNSIPRNVAEYRLL
jgi:hypothetical protein